MKRLLTVVAALLAVATAFSAGGRFVTVGDDGSFRIGDSVYTYVGTNLWYAPILASDGKGGTSVVLPASWTV